MVDMLICPIGPSDWRIDPEQFATWLGARWPDVAASSSANSQQRATLWTWPDGYEVWLPEGRNCCWVAADLSRIAAIAAYFGLIGPEDLVLCDEGYSFDLRLHGQSEADIQTALGA